MQGVAGDDGVGQDWGDFLKQGPGDGQFAVVLFAAVGGHGEGGSGGVVAEGDDGSEFAFAAEVLAVEGEGLGKEVAVGDEPAVEGAGEGGGIDGVDEVVEGVVAGHEEQAALPMAAGEADCGALPLGERAAFFPDAFDVGRAAEQAVTDEGEHGAEGMAAGFGAARIIDPAQGVAQAAEGFDRQGAAGSAGGFGDAGTVRFGQLAGEGEQGGGVFLQGVNPELFGAFEVLIEVGAVAAEAFGEAQRGPVGDFVKGALVEGGIVEALGEQGAEAVKALPFGGQFAQGAAEALAAEIGAAVGVDDDEAAQLHDLLNARFATDPAVRVAAIEGLRGDISTEARRALNQILATRSDFAPEIPEGTNVARIYTPAEDMDLRDAYARLADAGLFPARPGRNAIRDALRANVVDGSVGGVPVHLLTTDEMRRDAYLALEEAGTVAPLVTEADMQAAVAGYVFFEAFLEPDPAVTDAARASLDSTRTAISIWQFVGISLDAISLASIFFLAAIGLAITFGVMRVINMAHGEFIMMGAYTGYVVQTVIPNYTTSLVIALPLAFLVTFAAGVAMERLVIRHLYTRPLETLLATFGISIALQQLAKNIFGTQARPLTSPDWLAGAIQVNDVVSVASIRVAIFVMAIGFLLMLLYILNRTRLGLEVRAVTQNPGMAASMGINPDRINMLTFGLGSGIAGVAGVAIGLVAQVTSEMGANYIVQSFMTVVVGGVGSVFGTLAGATLIGFLQKGIEWFNPANTLAAQTFMVLFIILFIQFRPKGIVALKGRAAGD